jgi:hypothetical protein
VIAEQGVAEIDGAKWEKDHEGWLSLHVHKADGADIVCHLALRPVYCDRGHIMLLIDGPLGIDSADSFPRYFFPFQEADLHTRTFLKWRIWKYRTHPHRLDGGMKGR